MAARQKRITGKLPEESKILLKEADQQRDSKPEIEAEGMRAIVGTSAQEEELTLDFPFRKSDSSFPDSEKLPKMAPGFQNQAPLQADEQAKELLRSTLQHPISLTTEDLLNVSEPVRLELEKLLTKQHVEKKSVTFAGETSKVDGPWRDI